VAVRPFAVLLILLAAGILLATRFLAVPWVVLGDSMEPSLSRGDRVIVDVWTYRHRAPRPGEIALFRGPLPDEPILIKRVVTNPPGEAPAPRPELWPEQGDPFSHRVVWVRGDNEPKSVDSRLFGPVPADRLRGRVVFRYWPLSRAGPMR
jgi:signal peptidase I